MSNRILLVIIAVLLMANLVATVAGRVHQVAGEEQQTFQYRAVSQPDWGEERLQARINYYARRGWELTHADGDTRVLIFRRAAESQQ